eukprot:gene2686-3108_t
MGLQQDDSTRFSCEICKKKYKTKSGLNRHNNKKHGGVAESNPQELLERESVNNTSIPCLNTANIVELVQQSKEELSKNERYPLMLRENITQYQFHLTEELQSALCSSYSILAKHADADKFFSFFYSKVVLKAEELVPGLQKPMSTLLAKNLGDKILYFFRKPQQLPSPEVKPISNKEIDGLQYLAGYVIHMLLKKARNGPNYKSEASQTVLCILNNFMEEDCVNQRLISATNRGGLTAVKTEIQQIFIIAEETFRGHASTTNHISKINTGLIISQLMTETRIISLYNSLIVEDDLIKKNSEVKKNLLENKLKLYLRVRAFSFANDLTNRHKYALKKNKEKALRKDIKKATDKPNITE